MLPDEGRQAEPTETPDDDVQGWFEIGSRLTEKDRQALIAAGLLIP